MSLEFPVYLRSIEAYIAGRHGSVRPLTATEMLVMDPYVMQIVDDVQDAWPVDTSTSRDAWAYELRDAPGEMGFVLENGIDYVQYVHLTGETVPLWEYLLPSVVGRYTDEMLAALRAAVDETERVIQENAAGGGRGFLDVVARRFRIPALEGVFGGR